MTGGGFGGPAERARFGIPWRAGKKRRASQNSLRSGRKPPRRCREHPPRPDVESRRRGASTCGLFRIAGRFWPPRRRGWTSSPDEIDRPRHSHRSRGVAGLWRPARFRGLDRCSGGRGRPRPACTGMPSARLRRRSSKDRGGDINATKGFCCGSTAATGAPNERSGKMAVITSRCSHLHRRIALDLLAKSAEIRRETEANARGRFHVFGTVACDARRAWQRDG